MTTQEQEQTRNLWNDIAANYDTFVTPKNIVLAEEALRLAGLRPGMRFLDVAAGSGALSIPAARLGAQAPSTSPDRRMESHSSRTYRRGCVSWCASRSPAGVC
jgi:ubiquinone/menaquinone biosynthesis C-methylase UbiE